MTGRRVREFSTSRLTHLFSAQLADHDTTFSPVKPVMPWRKVFLTVAGILMFTVFIIPSFRIAKQIQQTPTFAIPEKIKAGALFILPADPSVASIQASGRALHRIDEPQPIFVGSISPGPAFEFALAYRAPERKFSFKRLLPKFENPTVPVFAKRILIEGAPTDEVTATPAGKEAAAKMKLAKHAALVARKPGSEPDPVLTKPTAIERVDREMNAGCWTQPQLTLIETPPPPQQRKHGHHVKVDRFATVSLAGPGEVVQTLGVANSDKAVVLYHGGGLYSRYAGLKDLRVRKGEKLKTGQIIGTQNAGTWREPASVNWNMYLDQTEINPESFLALSSQLCDSK